MAEAAVKAEAEKPEVPPTAKVTEINDTLTRAKPETTTEKTEAVPSVLPASREKAKVPEKVNKVEQKKTTEEVYHQMSLFDLL